jgi:hypothetical protein
MASFLNLEIDRPYKSKFLLKHLKFTLLWFLGIGIFILRIDVLLLNSIEINAEWMHVAIPVAYILLLFYSCYTDGWYTIAFIFYPLLFSFWFLPKTILSKGKLYLFTSYISFIYNLIKDYKKTFFRLLLICSSLFLFIFFRGSIPRLLLILDILYFYIRYLYSFINSAVHEPKLFGTNLTKKLEEAIEKTGSVENSLVKAFVVNKQDEKLETVERREKQIRRSVIVYYTIKYLLKKVEGYSGRSAINISLMYRLLMFLCLSIIFFYFLNYQMYQLSSSTFLYTGKYPGFDFLYYTLKTVSFNESLVIKPTSIITQIIQMSSFLLLGVFLFVVFMAFYYSSKQDQLNKNLQLTSNLISVHGTSLEIYIKEELGTDIKTAIKEVKNIDESWNNLKRIIDKFI